MAVEDDATDGEEQGDAREYGEDLNVPLQADLLGQGHGDAEGGHQFAGLAVLEGIHAKGTVALDARVLEAAGAEHVDAGLPGCIRVAAHSLILGRIAGELAHAGAFEIASSCIGGLAAWDHAMESHAPLLTVLLGIRMEHGVGGHGEGGEVLLEGLLGPVRLVGSQQPAGHAQDGGQGQDHRQEEFQRQTIAIHQGLFSQGGWDAMPLFRPFVCSG